jgi:hypothetical protein
MEAILRTYEVPIESPKERVAKENIRINPPTKIVSKKSRSS